MKSKISLFAFFLMLSCSTNFGRFNALEDFLLDNHHLFPLTQYTYIVLINERGVCIDCCNTFAKEMAKHIDNDQCLFLVSSDGGSIDISEYLRSRDQTNIIFDFEQSALDIAFINSAGIIFLGENTIDSIIEIKPLNVTYYLDHFPNF